MLAHRIISSPAVQGRNCLIGHVGPDLIVEVDGVELGAFYRSTADAWAGIHRHIAAQEKAAQEKESKIP
jgi:hypothetical protein